ncbi:MAG: hypothetical protein KF760_17880 [Candidatus Eremiobacteraeota bacterium]|nr:hypothetical protein [Candidatus Eremiobacteraeota bacterium]MCW5869251.1 hypothetical protein [Candidatus Eremiobacteraeota bacterium]
MPVIHTAHDPDQRSLGYLLAHWSGVLEPEDCLSITPDGLMAAAADAHGCSLELRVPEFLKDDLEFEVNGPSARVVLPGLQCVMDARHKTLPWVPAVSTELRWECDLKVRHVQMVLRLTVDNNQRQSMKTWRDGAGSLPAPDFGGPFVTFSWWGKPRRRK